MYTVDTSDSRGASFLPDKVTGCLASIDAEIGGGVLADWFCVKRDMTSAKRDSNYLATSPLIALNARGAGKHTLFVMQWDTVVLALDPSNLKGGLLYALDPLPNQDEITIATDFLAMTARGTLLWEGWDSTQKDATILALPGVLNCPPGACGSAPGGPGPSANSAGRSAGIAIGVIGGLGVAIGGFVWWAGGVAAALALVSGACAVRSGGGGGGSFGKGAGFGQAYSAVSSSGLSSSSSGSAGAKASTGFSSSGGYGSL